LSNIYGFRRFRLIFFGYVMELTLDQEWDIFLIMDDFKIMRQRQEMFKIIGICLYLLGYR
jgi:hypothetical protein